ncbi:hypothetical protein [Streptacidiphilus sp. MAP12-16]|uniref:hypothetical protein n=1 Tax=Streptacidiphilus sp. MAP12-16 TaxID=3156300 RepID=UPI003518E2AF
MDDRARTVMSPEAGFGYEVHDAHRAVGSGSGHWGRGLRAGVRVEVTGLLETAAAVLGPGENHPAVGCAVEPGGHVEAGR